MLTAFLGSSYAPLSCSPPGGGGGGSRLDQSSNGRATARGVPHTAAEPDGASLWGGALTAAQQEQLLQLQQQEAMQQQQHQQQRHGGSQYRHEPQEAQPPPAEPGPGPAEDLHVSGASALSAISIRCSFFNQEETPAVATMHNAGFHSLLSNA